MLIKWDNFDFLLTASEENTSAYFLSKITASASLLIMRSIISLSGNALSNGTTTMSEVVIAK